MRRTTTLVLPSAQVKAWADSRSLQVIGVYHANERLDDREFGPGPRKIADKLQQQCSPTACGLLVCAVGSKGLCFPLPCCAWYNPCHLRVR